jgi:4,5-DOPA dioxygenase extradiol
MSRPRVIHDFYGFPQELFDFDYPVGGSPDLARQVAEIAKPSIVSLDDASWGIDHGTWSVLAHMYPNADVPVVQLAIDATASIESHMELGAKLAPLMDEEVMIVASGNVVHNLRVMQWGAGDQAYDWAARFDRDAKQVLQDSPSDFASLRSHGDFTLSAPTPEHFLPLAYLAGIAAVKNEKPSTIVEGCTYGSISMAAYAVA